MVRVPGTIRAEETEARSGAALPEPDSSPARVVSRSRAIRGTGRRLTDADLAHLAAFVAYWGPRVSPNEGMALCGLLTLMNENRRRWEEFKTDDFTEEANCLPDGREFSPSGYRRALAALYERGLLKRKRRGPKGTAWTFDTPLPQEKGDENPVTGRAANRR